MDKKTPPWLRWAEDLERSFNQLERKSVNFVTTRLPTYDLIRVFLGLIYFWFGALKFNFVPGQSPAEDLIRTVWGPYINADLFIQTLAIFETGMGLLLLLNQRVKLAAVLLIGHVLGTFTTVILDPSSAFRWDMGPFSLTLAGQYILKNLLILSSCLFLLYQGSRGARRRDFRAHGTLVFERGEFPVLFQDLSEGGLSFLVQQGPGLLFGPNPFTLKIYLPLEGRWVKLVCQRQWISTAAIGEHTYYRVGCQYLDQAKAQEIMRQYLAPDALPRDREASSDQRHAG